MVKKLRINEIEQVSSKTLDYYGSIATLTSLNQLPNLIILDCEDKEVPVKIFLDGFKLSLLLKLLEENGLVTINPELLKHNED